MTDKPKKPTLSDAEITTRRGIGRRAFLLGTLGGTTALAGCVTATTGITDSDLGAFADAVGNGRGARTTGLTDRDPSDPVGNGRGMRTSGLTDRDPSDPVGNGRGMRTSGLTDRDPSDPVGNGRGVVRRRGITDSDSGSTADPAGWGRG
ncbi:MAG: hypothetical protein R3D60_12995 [Paracoccaceae bacterium]